MSLIVIAALTFLLGFATSVERGEECIDHNGQKSICTSIYSCKSVTNAAIGDNVQISGKICGIDNKEPLVCCQTEEASTSLPPSSSTQEAIYTSSPLESNQTASSLALQANVTSLTKTSASTTTAPVLDSKKTIKLLPNRNMCGFQKSRERLQDFPISTIDEFPWIVLIKYRYGYGYSFDYPVGYRCLGTLISTRYVITAAGCIDPEFFYVDEVRLGEWSIPYINDCVFQDNSTLCTDATIDVRVQKKIIHPQYDPSCARNDVALMRLERNLDFSDYIRPICLPVQNLLPPTINTNLTTSGWGVTRLGHQLDIKSKINLPVIDKQRCTFTYNWNLSQNHACLGSSWSNTLCRTDSGGPLMAVSPEDKPQWYLEGVISRGFACNQQDYPGVYTRITAYVGWILASISEDSVHYS